LSFEKTTICEYSTIAVINNVELYGVHGGLFFWLQVENEIFFNEFIYHVKHFLIVFKREPAVERGMEFVAKFCTSLQNMSMQSADDQNSEAADTSVHDDMHPFLLQLFKFLLKVKFQWILFCQNVCAV